jgi:hypothetical protein
MKINSDFRDLLRSFNAAGVRYLIVGGYAVMIHTEPRYTKDLDLWIDAVADNARRMIAALNEFGAPTSDIQPSDFTEPEVFFQIGVEPVRIDILTSVTGLGFEGAWERRITAGFRWRIRASTFPSGYPCREASGQKTARSQGRCSPEKKIWRPN